MGYSCRAEAGSTLDKISAKCRAQGGSSNQYTDPKTGKSYFYEVGRENSDGRITGSVHLMSPNGTCRQSGTFCISPEGVVVRGPAWMK